MPLDFAALQAALRERFPAQLLGWTTFRDQPCAQVKREQIAAILTFLRDDPRARFEMLTDLTVVDRLRLPEEQVGGAPERFLVVYQLTSLTHNAQFRVKAFVPEEPCEIDTATGVWPAANWAEREAYDMFGVVFKGHPGLKRILMPDDYQGYPLRKDYPLKGRGERDRAPQIEGLTD